jgi:AhpD family alkylhydroperoxidase
MTDFRKRTYSGPGELFQDIGFIFRNVKKLRDIRRRGLISEMFRERLMLAVTAVNGCRYCSYFHTRQALKSGMSKEEIDLILSSTVESCPPEEAVAVLYAQHWAETNACPEPDASQKLMDSYGEEKAGAINLMLRMIRTGNLSGNSFDYFLYRISGGKWGK